MRGLGGTSKAGAARQTSPSRARSLALFLLLFVSHCAYLALLEFGTRFALHQQFWKMEVGNAVNFVGGTTAKEKTKQGGGGRGKFLLCMEECLLPRLTPCQCEI